MALTLRTQTDARFTTKASELTHIELDDNFIGIHDLIDANTTTLTTISTDLHTTNEDTKLDEGGGNEVSAAELKLVVDGTLVQSSQTGSTNPIAWDGSRVILVDTTTETITVVIGTADIAANVGGIIYIKDIGTNAATRNITVDTETGEKIDGVDIVHTISTDDGYVILYVGSTTELWVLGEA